MAFAIWGGQGKERAPRLYPQRSWPSEVTQPWPPQIANPEGKGLWACLAALLALALCSDSASGSGLAIHAQDSLATPHPGFKRGLSWADLVFVMEKRHLEKLRQNFPEAMLDKEVVTLGIPDDYEYMHPDLVDELRARVSAHIELPGEP